MTTNTHSSIVVGVFIQAAQAKKALDALQRMGFTYDQIGVATPGYDQIDLLSNLQDFSMQCEPANYYAQEFQSGHIIVSVRPDARDQEARDILRQNGAYDYDHRMATPQTATAEDQQMQSNPDIATSRTGTAEQAMIDRQNDFYQPRSLKLRGEQLNVTREQVQSGEVALHKEVVTEQKTFTVPVSHEEVIVERHAPSGESVDSVPIGQGEILRIPVSEEQINITKQTVVTGEVSIGKRIIQENKQVTETVKHEEEHLEHEGEISDLTIHDASQLDKGSREQA